MKKTFALIALVLMSNIMHAQKNNWFRLYDDSTALVKDGNTIKDKFIGDIKKINPAIAFNVPVILNTTPALIYYNDQVVNLPLWTQVIPGIREWMGQIAGGNSRAEDFFGLFFNGFYLPHELGHALQHVVEGATKGSYQNEYFANTVAMLWWRKQGKDKELKQCYDYAKSIKTQLSNPVPEGKSIEDFFTENYEQATMDPSVYGYMQFTQFIEIYENNKLPDFDAFIKGYMDKK